jgi:hypothetical protein
MRITEAFFRSPEFGEWTDDLAPGLVLIVRPAKTGRLRKSWVLRTVIDGVRRKVGLGVCGLAEARKRAAEARQAIYDGNDPSPRAKARARASLRASETVRGMSFGKAGSMAAACAEAAQSEVRTDSRSRAAPSPGANPR